MDSVGVTYVVGDNGVRIPVPLAWLAVLLIMMSLKDGCEVVAFDPVSGASHVISTCPDGAALSLYTSVVITNNAAGDVILFPLAVGSEWTMVAITTSGKSLWSAQINGSLPLSLWLAILSLLLLLLAEMVNDFLIVDFSCMDSIARY